jgi:NRAMP (natural resistance-associated macrophage protein)-like metal ion transporter
LLRSIGLGLITGAADDDPSAVGTYASAGAAFGPAFLWTAPAAFPMMVTVVYLSSKLGQVSGKGLFDVLRDHYPKWLLQVTLIGAVLGNTIEAGADIGGMAAAVGVLAPLPAPLIVVPVTIAILVLQIWGSYTLLRNVFRWLSLSLLSYVAAAVLAHPDLGGVLRNTFVPHVRFDRQFLAMIVAVIGTSLSAYLWSWQSNEEVEEEIAMGRRRLSDRRGATRDELRHTRWDVTFGMLFSSLVMYFVMLAAASTLYPSGQHDITTAAQAAHALEPFAGRAAGLLFCIGILAVGCMAVPIMTTGAAYDICQTLNWKHGLHAKPTEAKRFYALIAGVTLAGMAINFLGLNPMKMLVWAGVVQGLSAPPLMLLLMLLTRRRDVMGDSTNGALLTVLGWGTTVAIFAAAAGLVWMTLA